MPLPIAVTNSRPAPVQPAGTPSYRSPRGHRVFWIIAACVICALLVGGILLATHWPFTRQSFTQRLEQDAQGHVAMASFRETYFPHPGCVAEGVTIERDPSSPRLTIRRLTVDGSYIGLLAHYIPKIVAEGAVLNVPQGALGELFADRAPGQHPSNTKIGELNADGAQIVVQTPEGGSPLNFQFNKLLLNSVSSDSAIRFNAALAFPLPHGDVTTQGSIGPFRRGQAGQTPLNGSYTVTNQKVGELTGVGGVLSSKGNFQGQLQAIDVKGSTDTPDFQLDVSMNPVHLRTEFHVVVNGTNGNIELAPVQSTFAKTKIVSNGSINESSKDRHPNGVAVDMVCSSGRVEDLVLLFIKDSKSPMVGAVNFRAHAALPFRDGKFLDKVKLEGDFGIANASYTSANTQKQVDLMSAKARGQADKLEDDQDHDNSKGTNTVDQDLERVVSDLKGHVALAKGVATFSDLTFHVPGAGARVHGTYDLRTKAINLQGVVHMETQVSHATTGPKSFLLKMIQPLTKHNHRQSPNGSHGSVVSVHMTGTYGQPQFAVAPIGPATRSGGERLVCVLYVRLSGPMALAAGLLKGRLLKLLDLVRLLIGEFVDQSPVLSSAASRQSVLVAWAELYACSAWGGIPIRSQSGTTLVRSRTTLVQLRWVCSA